MRLARPHPVRATVRIVLLAVSALALFGITVLVCALPLLWFKSNLHASAGLLLVGVVCGLIAWLFVAIFHIRRESLTLLHDSREVLDARLRRELDELGYEVSESAIGRTVFKPRFSAFLVGGAVQVAERPGGVIVTGPKVFVELLRKRMKMLQHITSLQQSINESRVRQGRHLLRRVEIDLRVSAAQWQKVHDDVISVLAAQDANIICEVHILAQNESGILDTAIETDIRERLRQQNIAVEIRKEARPSVEHKLAAVSMN